MKQWLNACCYLVTGWAVPRPWAPDYQHGVPSAPIVCLLHPDSHPSEVWEIANRHDPNVLPIMSIRDLKAILYKSLLSISPTGTEAEQGASRGPVPADPGPALWIPVLSKMCPCLCCTGRNQHVMHISLWWIPHHASHVSWVHSLYRMSMLAGPLKIIGLNNPFIGEIENQESEVDWLAHSPTTHP